MFTLNCTVNDKEVLRYKKKKDKKRKGRKRAKIQDRRRKSRSRSKSLGRASDATDTEAEDLYHPGKRRLKMRRLIKHHFQFHVKFAIVKLACLTLTNWFISSM